jgi:hypothetical protein
MCRHTYEAYTVGDLDLDTSGVNEEGMETYLSTMPCNSHHQHHSGTVFILYLPVEKVTCFHVEMCLFPV